MLRKPCIEYPGAINRLYENDFGKGQGEEIILFRISPADNTAKIIFVKPIENSFQQKCRNETKRFRVETRFDISVCQASALNLPSLARAIKWATSISLGHTWEHASDEWHR